MYHLCTEFFLRCACCVFINFEIHFTRVCSFQVVNDLPLDLQDDSDVAKSDVCSEVQ